MKILLGSTDVGYDSVNCFDLPVGGIYFLPSDIGHSVCFGQWWIARCYAVGACVCVCGWALSLQFSHHHEETIPRLTWWPQRLLTELEELLHQRFPKPESAVSQPTPKREL